MRALLILLLFLGGCQSKSPLNHFSGIAMTIPYHVTVGGKLSAEQRKEIESILAQVFEKTHHTFNNWNPDSEVSRFNHLPVGEKVVLSQELTDLLLLAKRVHTLSKGRFDPTVGKIAAAWKRSMSQGKIPHIDLPVGIDKLYIDEKGVWKGEEIELDLGGIAKGHAVDLLTSALLKSGYCNLYVEWGGEVRTLGLHPEGRKWIVAIKGIGIVEMGAEAMATSGNYEQRWSIDNTSYTHIIDPRTKRPLEVTQKSIASATVIAPTCAYADAVATALMLFETPEEAVAWAESLEDIKVWVGRGIHRL